MDAINIMFENLHLLYDIIMTQHILFIDEIKDL